MLHRFDDAVRFARMGIEISRDTSTVPRAARSSIQYAGGRTHVFGRLSRRARCHPRIAEATRGVTSGRPVSPVHRLDPQPKPTAGKGSFEWVRTAALNLNRPLEAAAQLEEAFQALEPFAQKDSYDYEDCASVVATAGNCLGDVLRHDNPKRALGSLRPLAGHDPGDPGTMLPPRRVEALLLSPVLRTPRAGSIAGFQKNAER